MSAGLVVFIIGNEEGGPTCTFIIVSGWICLSEESTTPFTTVKNLQLSAKFSDLKKARIILALSYQIPILIYASSINECMIESDKVPIMNNSYCL